MAKKRITKRVCWWPLVVEGPKFLSKGALGCATPLHTEKISDASTVHQYV